MIVERVSASFAPGRQGIAGASAWLDEAVKAPMGVLMQLHIILDEICSNIVRYSGASFFGLAVETDAESGVVRIEFSDDGKPYDPLAHADPDITLPAAERPIGGLGIMMVKKMADSVSYRREGGRNLLTVTLKERKQCK